MISQILSIAGGATRTAKGFLRNREARDALSRLLVLELRSNLNLLELLPRTRGERTPPRDLSDWEWRANSLETEALTAYLTFENHPVQSLLKTSDPTGEQEESFVVLMDALGYILIKVREIRAIADAPEEASLPDFDWSLRHKNLVNAHLRALSFLGAKNGR